MRTLYARLQAGCPTVLDAWSGISQLNKWSMFMRLLQDTPTRRTIPPLARGTTSEPPPNLSLVLVDVQFIARRSNPCHLWTGVWEYSVRQYLKGFSDAIIPEATSPQEKAQAILTWMLNGPPRLEATPAAQLRPAVRKTPSTIASSGSVW